MFYEPHINYHPCHNTIPTPGLEQFMDRYKGKIEYVWNVNPDTKGIEAKNPAAKHIIDIVNYYD